MNSIPPDAPDMLRSAAESPQDILARHAPWFGYLAMSVLNAGRPFMREFTTNGDRYPAASIIFNQAMADQNGLMLELSSGNGRSAVRTARSLIEHAVNLADVIKDPAQAERYSDHLVFEAEFSEQFKLGLELLPRSERSKTEKQRKHRLQKVARKLAVSLQKYGKRFRMSWAEGNLKDRAEKYGLGHLYPAYRLCSLFTHGASGAELGLVKQIDGKRVMRAGPAVHLCSFAYIAGVYALEEVVKAAHDKRPDLDADPLLDAIADLKKAWPEFADAVKKADAEIWPGSSPPPPFAILAIAQNGMRRWYWHDPDVMLLIEADPPVLDQVQQENINRVVKDVLQHPDRFFSDGRRFATAAIIDVVVAPRRGSPMLHSAALLLRPEEVANMQIIETRDI